MDIEAKRTELLGELASEIRRSGRKACRFEVGVGALKWFLWTSLGANGILGIVASLLPDPAVVKPGYFTFLSAVAGASYYLFKISSWRKSQMLFMRIATSYTSSKID